MLYGNTSGLGKVVLPTNVLMTVWPCKKEDVQIEAELQRYLETVPAIKGIPAKKHPSNLFLAPGARKDDWAMQFWVLPQCGHDDRLCPKLSPLEEYLDEGKIADRDTRLYLEAHIIWSGQPFDESEESWPNYDVCLPVDSFQDDHSASPSSPLEHVANANDSGVESTKQKHSKKKKKPTGNQRKKIKEEKDIAEQDAIVRIALETSWPNEDAREHVIRRHKGLLEANMDADLPRRTVVAGLLADAIKDGEENCGHLTANGMPRYPLEDVALRNNDTYFPDEWPYRMGLADQKWLMENIGLGPRFHADGSTAVWCAMSEMAHSTVQILHSAPPSQVELASTRAFVARFRPLFFAW